MTDTATRLEHRYEPRGACLNLFLDRSPEIIVSGPAGTGKSRACLEKVHGMLLANEHAKGLMVRKTMVSLRATALQTYKNDVAKEARSTNAVKWFGGSTEDPPGYRYRETGSFLGVAGMNEPTRIMSSEWDVIYVQEAIELSRLDWESLSTRLRNGQISFQQLIGDTNPSTPTHWIKQSANEGGLRLLESRHEDNPTLVRPDGTYTVRGHQYLARLDKLTGARKLRLRNGLWVSAEGIIFEGWDEAVHLVDRFPIPDSWTRWWTIDFGYIHPFVLQCWAEDDDGRLYRYREIFMTGRLVEDHAKQILSIVRPDGVWAEPKPRAIICDHDAEGRATFERHVGMATVPAIKKVIEGLQVTTSRFRVAGDGKPRLVYLRDSLVERDPELVLKMAPCCTEEEIPGYVWADTAKEQPVKEGDDGCDATRYMVAHRDLGSQPRVRHM